MVDKINKALAKLSPKKQQQILALFQKIKAGDFVGLDRKKLKGYANLYRVRKGRIRVIYTQDDTGIQILAVKNRDDQTYR